MMCVQLYTPVNWLGLETQHSGKAGNNNNTNHCSHLGFLGQNDVIKSEWCQKRTRVSSDMILGALVQ